MHKCLVGNANDAARNTATSIAGDFAIRMGSAAKIILVGMHHHRTTNDTVWTNKHNLRVFHRHVHLAILSGMNVAKIT